MSAVVFQCPFLRANQVLIEHRTCSRGAFAWPRAGSCLERLLELLASPLRQCVVCAARRVATKPPAESVCRALHANQSAVSLAVERPLHTRKVTGSNPVPRTISDFLTSLDQANFLLSILLILREFKVAFSLRFPASGRHVLTCPEQIL
jgi:hypothetical protein